MASPSISRRWPTSFDRHDRDGALTEWILELDCLWRTARGGKPCQFKLGKPWIVPEGDPLSGVAMVEWYFTRLGGPLKAAGFDRAQAKQLPVGTVIRFLNEDRAKLVDRVGQPVNLRALTPIFIDDYDDVERVPSPGHPPDTPWRIDRQCVWTEAGSSRAFRLRISSLLDLAGPGRGRRVAADHPLLGNLLIHDSSLYAFTRAILDLADWRRARILDEQDSPVDFEALTDELRGA